MRSLALLVTFVVAVPAAAAARAVIPEDLSMLQFVSGTVISHDGSRVAFVVRRVDVSKNEYRSNVWLVDVADPGDARPLTQGDDDEDPQWSPDDRTLAFVRTQKDRPQIYRIAVAGGEAQRLTDLPNGATTPRWSHDGQRILFSSSTKDEQPRARIDWKALQATPTSAQRTSDLRTIDRMTFALNGQGLTYNRHAHLYVMGADGSHVQALTSGHEWAEINPAWSPDDRTIVFNTLRRVDIEAVDVDVYTVPAAGGTMQRIPLRHRASANPTWLHDGGRLLVFTNSANDPAQLAGLAETRLDGSGDRTVVAENALAFGDWLLTDTKESGAGCGPLLEPRDHWFVALVSVPGATELRRFDLATGESAKLVGGDGEIAECSLSEDGTKLAYDWSDATHPAEVFAADLTSGKRVRLTDRNGPFLRDVSLAPFDGFTVKDRAGFDVHAWIVHPPDAAPGRRYPTLLEIHGGPESEFGDSFFHEFQVLAARGYNVVFADPRGSVGFGYPFEAALEKNWGAPMFDDEMAVMDAVVKRPEVDASRLGVLGGSYGGYATLWIIGHTHRFRTAIAERAVSNLVSETLATDVIGKTSATYSFGDPWDYHEFYWRQSPLAYVRNVTTPVLLIHSDNDLRTPIDQTLQEFSALKILGKTTELVEFPRENHDLSRTGEPLHRIERLHVIADWLDRYLKS